MDANTPKHKDAALIAKLGGAAQVAKLLNFDTNRGGVQRVQNWTTRGIPAAVKVAYPHLFMPKQGRGRVDVRARSVEEAAEV